MAGRNDVQCLQRRNCLNTMKEGRRHLYRQCKSPMVLSNRCYLVHLLRILLHRATTLRLQVSVRQYQTKMEQRQEDTNVEMTPPFSCLSCTVGSDHGDIRIQVNGKLLAVSRNLWNFLNSERQRLATIGSLDCPSWSTRYKDELAWLSKNLNVTSLFLWVDVLCIDLQNYAEKGHQVQAIDSIYARAVLGLLWLRSPSYSPDDCDQTLVQRLTLSDREMAAITTEHA